jgi:hypothetical protein
MTDAFWSYFFAALPATIIALANLIATIRGQRRILDTADGNKNMIIEAVGRVSKVEGKVDVLESQPRTIVVGDRRKEPAAPFAQPDRRTSS